MEYISSSLWSSGWVLNPHTNNTFFFITVFYIYWQSIYLSVFNIYIDISITILAIIVIHL